jgi:acylphosphatase
MQKQTARLYVISGRVQGVGYRAFAVRAAGRVGVSGWVRNLADGSVEVYARGGAAQLDELEGWLRKGPPFADVRGVTTAGAADEAVSHDTREFYIRS